MTRELHACKHISSIYIFFTLYAFILLTSTLVHLFLSGHVSIATTPLANQRLMKRASSKVYDL